MTITTLFGTEAIANKARNIKFKQIKAVYQTFAVKEEITNYLKPNQRYTEPSQVYKHSAF